jgi:hypothetical protein
MNDFEVELFKNDHNSINELESKHDEFLKSERMFNNRDDSAILFEEDKFGRSSLIKDLEDKWEQIERNKRMFKTKKNRFFESKIEIVPSLKDSGGFNNSNKTLKKGPQTQSMSNLNTNNNSMSLVTNLYENRMKSKKKNNRKKSEGSQDSGEFYNFINTKIRQLEKFQREHSSDKPVKKKQNSHQCEGYTAKPKYNDNNNISSYTKADTAEQPPQTSRGKQLNVVKDTNAKRDNSEVKQRSFLRRDDESNNTSKQHDQMLFYESGHVEELTAPSKTLLNKMQNIYGMIAHKDSDNIMEECENNDKQYTLNSLEQHFEDIVSKINPNLKMKKSEFDSFTVNKKQKNHQTRDQKILNIIDESTRSLYNNKTDDSGFRNTRDQPVKIIYHYSDKVYAKNNFDNVNGRLNLVNCSKLKKLLDLNKQV